jgi:hypothetical protein
VVGRGDLEAGAGGEGRRSGSCRPGSAAATNFSDDDVNELLATAQCFSPENRVTLLHNIGDLQTRQRDLGAAASTFISLLSVWGSKTRLRTLSWEFTGSALKIRHCF